MHEDDHSFAALLVESGVSRQVNWLLHAVRDLSLAYADRAGFLDRELLNAGALLHDIGRGVTHSLHHAQTGAEYCRKAGISPGIVRSVERHIGAGLTSDECTLLGILPIDCMPCTGEEKVVANADNLVRGSRVVSIYDRLESSRYLGRKSMFRTYRLWLFCEQIRRTPAREK